MAHRSTASSLARRWSFFMRCLLERIRACDYRTRLAVAKLAIRAVDADIVADQVALGACFVGKPTSSFHPIDFQSIRRHWACLAVPFADQQFDQHPISKAVRYEIPHADPRAPFLRISPPSRPPSVERLRVNPPLGNSSFHRPLAIGRASDDHNETPLNDEFRLEVPGSHSRHRRW